MMLSGASAFACMRDGKGAAVKAAAVTVLDSHHVEHVFAFASAHLRDAWLDAFLEGRSLGLFTRR